MYSWYSTKKHNLETAFFYFLAKTMRKRKQKKEQPFPVIPFYNSYSLWIISAEPFSHVSCCFLPFLLVLATILCVKV